VVLLHGFPQFADSWDELLPLLTGHGYRTIAPDQRGYSPHARPSGRGAYRIDELVADAVAVIDQCAGGGPVHLVGHDWGAAIAWALAGAHPAKVAGLTALSVPHPAAFLSSFLTSSQALHSWYMLFFQLPWLPERIGRSRLGARWLISSGQTPGRVERDLTRLAAPGALTGPLNYYRAMPLLRPTTARRPVRVPTLFIWSDGDIAITRRAATRCARWVRDAPYQFEVLDGVSHWIPEQAPQRLAELMLPHLRRCAQRPWERP